MSNGVGKRAGHRGRKVIPSRRIHRQMLATVLMLGVGVATAVPALAVAPTGREQPSSERKTEILYDVYQITNLMGRYAAYNRAGLDQQALALFALDTSGIAVEFPGEGRFIGKQKVVQRLIKAEQDRKAGDPFLRGRAQEHVLTSPLVVVADDGLTAKGIWSMPGWETLNLPVNRPGEPLKLQVQAFWAWGKYGVDFVKENGEWKIWHLHVYPTFFTPYDQDWVKTGGFQGGAAPPTEPPPAAAKDPAPVGSPPLQPSQPNGPFWSYRVEDTPPANLPEPPVPYRSFNETFSY